MTKAERIIVYNKYNGHCAYCGKAIEYKDMQVDHMIPQMKERHGWESADIIESIDNLYPSCRRCNHYKRAHTLKIFKKLIETIPDRLEQNYIFKIALDYGLVTVNRKKIKFYYENNNEGDT